MRAPRARAAMEACDELPAAPPGVSPPPASSPPIDLRSSPTEKCGPLAAMTTARTAVSPVSTAMAAGRSRHRSTPMALRASGRSSHSVATSPSCSIVSTGDSNRAVSSISPTLTALLGSQVGATRVHGPRSHSERGSTLHTFSAEASASLTGPGWLRARRAAGHRAFASTPLPSETEEVWRYTPIDRLALDEFAPGALRRPGAGRRGAAGCGRGRVGHRGGQRPRAQRACRYLRGRAHAPPVSPSGGPRTWRDLPTCSGRCSTAATPSCA